VTTLNDAAVQNRSVVASHQVAQVSLQALDSIDLAAINTRLQRWLNSPDQVLQLTAPGSSVVRLPTVDEVQQLRARIAQTSLTAPQLVAPEAPPVVIFTPPAAGQPGKVTGKRRFAAEQVEHWQLSNGDRLVWLRRNADNGQWRLQAESAAGFNRRDVPGWRLQMAAQLGSESGAPGLEAWRKQHKATLSLEHSATRLQLSASSQPSISGLTTVLQSYRQSQVTAVIDDALFSAARDDLLSRASTRPDAIAVARRELRYGADTWQTPDQAALEPLQSATLTEDWRQLVQAPVTYYLMADIEPAQLETVVREQLANIPRGVAAVTHPALQRPGQRRADLAVALEPRVVLEASSFSAHPWSPEAAARVAALRELANQQLKQRLRGEASGVYRLRFDSELNPDTQRIESQLSFTCDPQRAEELWALAQQTLAQLGQSVDAKWVAGERAELRRQEKKRLLDPTTQWRRLVLSEHHWQDPRYLSRQAALPDGLRIELLKPLASQLFPAHNQVLLRVLPKADAQ
jgi:zinc protease